MDTPMVLVRLVNVETQLADVEKFPWDMVVYVWLVEAPSETVVECNVVRGPTLIVEPVIVE